MSEHLNVEEMKLWHAWKTMSANISVKVLQEITDKSGLSEADFSVLSRVSEMGPGMLRQQQLADSLGWSKSRLSHHLTRMEERELIKRGPVDGEAGVMVHITAGGHAAIAAARPAHSEAVRRHLISRLSPGEREVILAVAARIISGD